MMGMRDEEPEGGRKCCQRQRDRWRQREQEEEREPVWSRGRDKSLFGTGTGDKDGDSKSHRQIETERTTGFLTLSSAGPLWNRGCSLLGHRHRQSRTGPGQRTHI